MEQKRKPVQINTKFDSDGNIQGMVVLCDDGTIWQRVYWPGEDDYMYIPAGAQYGYRERPFGNKFPDPFDKEE